MRYYQIEVSYNARNIWIPLTKNRPDVVQLRRRQSRVIQTAATEMTFGSMPIFFITDDVKSTFTLVRKENLRHFMVRRQFTH